MQIPDRLQCLFSAEIERRGDSSVIEIPTRELRHDGLQDGETYRVAILSTDSDDGDSDAGRSRAKQRGESGSSSSASHDGLEPPVDEGEVREVEIDALGDQGDGITRVERGFVVIVPDTTEGERVTIEITDVQENVAFAEVKERNDYFR